VQSCDPLTFTVSHAVELKDASITRLALPKLDATSKTVGVFEATLSPAHSVVKFGAQAEKCAVSQKQTPWLAGNFTVELDGARLKTVSEVSPIVVQRDVSGAFTVSGFTLSFGAQDLPVIRKWYEESVVKGSAEKSEKSLALVYLTLDLTVELGRVELGNVGIAKLARAGVGSSKISYRAGLYAETVAVTWRK
jgi:hypothetical protein